MPSGSRPLTGSSQSRTGGSPSSAAARPSRCRIPSEYLPARRRPTDSRPTRSSTSCTRRRPMPLLCARHNRWWIRVAPAVQCPGLEQRADLVQRPSDVAVAAAVDQYGAAARPVETDDHAHRRRLPGTVGAEESGDDTGSDVEAQPVDRAHRPVALAQFPCLDHHASLVRAERARDREAVTSGTSLKPALNRSRVVAISARATPRGAAARPGRTGWTRHRGRRPRECRGRRRS